MNLVSPEADNNNMANMAIQTHVEIKLQDIGNNTDSDMDSESDEMEIGENDSSNTDEDVGPESAEPSKGDHSSGLANVMAKILNNKAPKHKQIILAKGMTEKEIRKKKRQKIEGGEGDIDETKIAVVEKKKLWEEMARTKPHPLERDREKRLQKLATRGVVQLFNAVKKQQKTVEEKLSAAGGSERQRDKVMETVSKGAFLDLLKGTKVNVSKDGTEKLRKPRQQQVENNDNAEKAKWDILREDFMMGATMKDWDKDVSGDEDADGVVDEDDGQESDSD